jgi:hypothetical protein
MVKVYVHIRVRQRKKQHGKNGNKNKDFLPNHHSGSRHTYEMQSVNDDSMLCWIWRNKGVSEII